MSLYGRTLLRPGRTVTLSFYHTTSLARCKLFNGNFGRAAATAAASKPRAKKSKKVETVPFETLPQGLLPLDDSQNEQFVVEGYPTVLQQARNNMRKFENCVVLTRVGGFYELYFEHAEEYGPLLNLKVGSKRTSVGPVAMAGFPVFQLDRFLKTLVQDLGKHVAISEETANDPAQKVRSGGLLFDRQVKRVVTPGTLIDENFLRPYEHNYLLAIHTNEATFADESLGESSANVKPAPRVGMSWLDLSSGDFFTQSTDTAGLSSSVARIGPREIVLEKRFKDTEDHGLSYILKQEGCIITYYEATEDTTSISAWALAQQGSFSTIAAESFTLEETVSANLLLEYVKMQLPGLNLRLQAPIRRQAEDYLAIDKNSLRGLEVLQTLRDGLLKGSLLQAVRRTSTESGARLLAQRLSMSIIITSGPSEPGGQRYSWLIFVAYPSLSLSVINDRLNLVDELISNRTLLEDIVTLLRQTSDTLRLVQKFSFGRGDADDLLGLSRTIGVTKSIGEKIDYRKGESEKGLARLYSRFQWEGPSQVADRITSAIDEEGLMMRQRSQELEAAEIADIARNVLNEEAEATELGDLRKSLSAKRFNKTVDIEEEKVNAEDVWIMRRNATPTLARLHQNLMHLSDVKIQLTSSLRQKLRASTLTLKLTPGLGHICHVRGRDAKLDLSLLEHTRTVGSSKSTRSFYLPEWTKLGTQIEDAKLRIRAEEQSIFQSLRELVIQNLVSLRRNANVLDDLDVACSSARLAIEYDLKRPNLNHSCDLIVYGGRHIMVETGLSESGRQFTPNDCVLDKKESIWLITGPNMAGKSTFLRQTALISILAQTGSFVPAEYAEIGLVDRIFSRVGSADNLSQDQSTFMVEMLETAYILRNATRRSFVIMDEVGRGTTPEDGIAVGYAVLHHLQKLSKCRTLFATHFHALADMTKDFATLACYCTDVVDEDGGTFRYDHRLSRGVNRKSHALKVAMLAGMPQEAIDMASDILVGLQGTKENQELDAVLHPDRRGHDLMKNE